MSLWSRLTNLFHNDRLTRDLDEELESHVAEAVEQGRSPDEARKAFGSALHHREQSRDLKLIPWLDSLRADAVFGWRQLMKNKVTSASAILSLALAIGACTGAFRLIDALLLRPLPVAHADQLYALSRQGLGFDGKPTTFDGWAYPAFEQMRTAVRDDAHLLAISYADWTDITFGSDQEMEKAHMQYVSGSMFSAFGLRPTLGRLLDRNDDLTPGGHPFAVISYDYWTGRLGQDPKAIGRSVTIGDKIYEIIGVGPAGFTGTETGTATDFFVPAMMNHQVSRDDTTWHRTLAVLKPGAAPELVRAKLNATARAFERERAKGFKDVPKAAMDLWLNQTLLLEPAASGSSSLQRSYRNSLLALSVLVALVLLIACANVANLMTAQAASRAREMALRVSIGAGRARLLQLVLVESAWISTLAVAIGAVFAAWSAPFVVRMINPSDNPIRLAMPWDWRVFGFDLALTLVVTILFGLTPALRASATQPASALKGGEDAHSRRHLMHVLIAAQVAFCVVVLFVAGLFTASFRRLSSRPTGFSAERVLILDTVAHSPEPAIVWNQLAASLANVRGVEKVAIASWPLLIGYAQNSFLSINGSSPGSVLAYFLSVSPDWVDAMKLRLLDGRNLDARDISPGSALVNETFAKTFFNGESPVGKIFEKTGTAGPIRIVGLVSDAIYRDLHEPMLPVAYVPYQQVNASGQPRQTRGATLIVRTSNDNPLSLGPLLRQQVTRERPDFRVSTVRSQQEINQAQSVRERLLAMLALFFALVAVLLAGIGLYGVLDYSVLRRRREFGIRLAIGAPAFHIARLVSVEVLGVVIAGAAAGVALGLASVPYIKALFYEVNASDLVMLATPSLTILAVGVMAALRPIVHALRIDPVKMLRSE